MDEYKVTISGNSPQEVLNKMIGYISLFKGINLGRMEEHDDGGKDQLAAEPADRNDQSEGAGGRRRRRPLQL